ncbi:MAG: NADH-quinone oxidoreductase subunit N [archaeon]|nr:NADH-quinone oxidoreductase subunit N [archaeon]
MKMIELAFLNDTFGTMLAIMPEIMLIIGALSIPGLFYFTKNKNMCATAALIAIILSGVFAGCVILDSTLSCTFMNIFKLDMFAAVMIFLFLIVAFLTVLASFASSELSNHVSEYYSLLLIATTGMLFVASANNLLVIFVGVECTSILSYALVALKKNDPRSSEAAVKYLIIGGISSGLVLYGISMLYGLTGSIDIAKIAHGLENMENLNAPFVIAVISLIAGYGFKISAVPFHMWAPDAYEGAATPVSMFLSTGSKKMGFVVLFKIFIVMFAVEQSVYAVEEMRYIFAFIATITMTIGNIVAILQKNIKRMLAYSSIAQAGYILIALAVMSEYAVTGGIFHMITHVFMKGGAFIVVGALIAAGIKENISDYKGLAKRAPIVAFAMLLFLFSLAGIPPLAGFASKFVLFSSAIVIDGVVRTQWMWLAIIAIINSAISLYYYAKVVKVMYIDSGECNEKIVIKKSHLVAILLCMVFVVAIGVYPEPIIKFCEGASGILFGKC